MEMLDQWLVKQALISKKGRSRNWWCSCVRSYRGCFNQRKLSSNYSK